jgi:dihydropteroate synthase
MQGEPGTMQDQPCYENVFEQVYSSLLATARRLVEAGHPQELIVLDPGIGFGKTLEHTLTLLHAVERGNEDFSILWGCSRKSFIGSLTSRPDSDDRLAGTLATAAQAQRIGIDILRVHDIAAHLDLAKVLSALE